MVRVILILGFLFLMLSSLFGQNGVDTKYQHPKVIPPSYQLYYNTDSTLTYDSTVEKLSKKSKLKYLNNYKEQLKYMAESGLIYFDWQPVDGYLNDLLFKLTPDSLKNEIKTKAFVKKEITNNAMSMPNGHIYINIGLLANLKSEAALSFIIAHELAHYLKKHHLKNYKQTLLNDGKKKPSYYRFTHSNKHLEIEADEIALKLLCEQNIPIDGAIEVFKLMQNKGKPSNLNSMRLYFIEKQVNNISKKTNEHKPNDIFSKVSRLCKNEFLSILLEKNYYLDCINFGLSLTNETNSSMANYFIAEAIRRYLVLEPNNSEESVETVLNEYVIEKNIFNFDSISTNTLQKKLITIFKGLTSISNKLKNAELYFTNALYNLQNHQKQSLIKEDLQSYLNRENINYPLLTKYLLEPIQKEIKDTADQPVILVDLIKSFNHPSNKHQIDFEKQNNLNATLTPKLKQWLYAKYPDCKIVFIEDLVKAEFNTAMKLQNFFNVQDSLLLDTTTSLFLLKPNVFELFDLLETSSINYLKIETNEGSKLENDNVFNPLSFPSKISYLLKEKKQFSIKTVNIKSDETTNVEENTFIGKIKLSKITSYFEELIE